MNTSFKTWMAQVNQLFIDIVGMPYDCWPDQNYYDMWEGGFSPKDAVAEAVENEYGEDGLEAFGLESVR